ncbi:MAG: hypothetical protein EA341_07570 [Mongoliibacter sp.]|jgi:hypothetical protein|uniref:hypothetical protein n=1 Tax=Mongoliibacter sp. TaxID=2022438 RepID=UPI0012F051BA|nr:hypothetical protein [Mongoliibacter sp.]TVP50358.1 MAG: hypothetical protein EA341_07570 [Mongoliibacter sp.]
MWLLKNKASFVLVFLFCCMSYLATAQRVIDEEINPPLKDRLYYGGNFGASFGTITFVDVSPLVGAMVTNRLSGGVGATYQYFNDRRFFGGANSLYGGRVFGRYNIFPNFFAHAEYENVNYDWFDTNRNVFERIWVPAFFLGGGYFVPSGDRGGFNFTFLYNLLHDNRRSPYFEPYVIRVGFIL